MHRTGYPIATRYLVWQWNVVALIVVAQLATGSVSSAGEQPNILLILTDDQGWPTLGSYGGEIVATPNLDRLANQGARFTSAYVTSQCTPTRATLLTGQYTARHGLWHVLPWYGYPHARMTEPTFAENYSRETFTIAKGLRKAETKTATTWAYAPRQHTITGSTSLRHCSTAKSLPRAATGA